MSFKSNHNNAVVNRSHKRRNDYSNKSNIDEKFYDVGERGGEGEECLGG